MPGVSLADVNPATKELPLQCHRLQTVCGIVEAQGFQPCEIGSYLELGF